MEQHIIGFEYARKRGFPYYNLSESEKKKDLDKLLRFDIDSIISGDTIKQTMHCLGLCWSYFPHSFSVRNGEFKTPMEIFNDDSLLLKAIQRRIKRSDGTIVVRPDGTISDGQYRKALRTYSGVQAVSNFRPSAAAAIYRKYGGGIVWDMSIGFGGRFCGALASGVVSKYYGTDPSSHVMDGITKFSDDFKYIGIDSEFNKIGSEFFVTPEPVDICFTSPPYFNTEKYSEDDGQSFKMYNTIQDWNEIFLRGTIKNCFQSMKDTGFLILNVANVRTHTTLEEDTKRICYEEGFVLKETLKLTLSTMAAGFKYEPVFVFVKKNQ